MNKDFNSTKGIADKAADENVADVDIKEATAIDGQVEVIIEQDKMSAKIKLSPPIGGGKAANYDDVMKAIRDAGVVKGLKEEMIARIAKNQIYNMPFKIATGQEPVNGTDQQLKCYFNENVMLAPRVLEDGSTDYRNMGMGLDSVKAGDLVAEIIPSTVGKDGFNVVGDVMLGIDGQQLVAPAGENVYTDSTGTKLYASIDGNVAVKDNKVSVRKEIKVDCVDQTTGNIIFSGDVIVKKDVRDGFMVHAGGSVTIGGVVESAKVIAETDVIIKVGIHGESSSVVSGGTVTAGYIEMGSIEAKDCIYVDAALNATLRCDGKIILKGKRNCIIGGRAFAGLGIEAKVIGNSAYTATEVSVVKPDSIPKERERLSDLMRKNIEQLGVVDDVVKETTNNPTIAFNVKKEKLTQLALARKSLLEDQAGIRAEMDLYPIIDVPDGESYIQVNENIYPNVKITIDNVSIKNDFQRPVCRITKKSGKINFGTIK